MAQTTNYGLEKPVFDAATWHDEVNGNMDILDAVIFAISGLAGVIGVWTNSTAYTVGQRVVDTTDSTTWQVAVAHTSAVAPTTFSADRTANPTYWTSVSVSPVVRGQWVTATAYNKDEIVFDSAQHLYGTAKTSHTSTGASMRVDIANWNVVADLASAFPLDDGTLAAPALSFISELGSGLYRAGAGDIRFTLLGTDLVTFTAASMNLTGTFGLVERAASLADIVGVGQVWVKTATPNQLWFTNDAGTDAEIALLDGLVQDLDTLGPNSVDGEFIVGTGAGALAWESGATLRTSIGVAIGTDVQAFDAGLADIAGLAVTDGNVIVGNGVNWVAESGATARASLGAQAQGAVLDDFNTLGAAATDGEIIVATGAGAFAYESGATARASIGSAGIATQAEMETASSNTVAPTAGRQHFHPGHPKCWAYVTVSAGVPTLQTSYNVTSITDTGVGKLTITIATDFSTANWCGLVVHEGINNNTYIESKLAGSVLIHSLDNSGGGTHGNFADPVAWNFVGMGDQA